MENFLESYLVRLGFQSDEPSLRKLQGVMADAERTVTSHSGGMAKRILEAQGAILGVFTSISAAIIGTVDKVAMADQSYRLLGLRMLMTTESARKMDMITKALGASLEEIVWDPELHARAVEMGADIDKMTANLGADFKGNMKSIRDMHFEFDRLGVGVKFLGMQFANDLWKKLNPGEEGKTLHQWVDWFEAQIPKFSDKLVSYAVPALKQTWEMVKEVGRVLEAGTIAFTNLIGWMSGDKSIEGTALSFDHVAKAIQHVGDWFVKFFGWITHAEETLAHFAGAAALALHGDYAGAKKEFEKGFAPPVEPKHYASAAEGFREAQIAQMQDAIAEMRESHPDWDKSVRVFTDPRTSDNKAASASWKEFFANSAARGGAALWNLFGIGPHEDVDENIRKREHAKWQGGEQPKTPSSSATEPKTASEAYASISKLDIMAAIVQAANATSGLAYPVSSSLALAIAKAESGFQSNARSDKGAIGIMQLMPSTAKDLGVDPNDWRQNIGGGVMLLSQLLEKYQGNVEKAIEAYNAGPSRVDKTKDFSSLPEETRNYLPEVLKYQKMFEGQNAAKENSAPLAPVIERGAPAQSPIPPSPTPSPAVVDRPTAYMREPSVQQPLWMQPPADDTAPSVQPSPWERPQEQASIMTMDWSPVIAAMQRLIVPQPTVNHVQQHLSVDVGGIYITQPGADERTIHRIVTASVKDAMAEQIQDDVTQISPAY